ncbi:hypothetical protein UT300015_36650 [Clostridium tertium]
MSLGQIRQQVKNKVKKLLTMKCISDKIRKSLEGDEENGL